MPVAQRRHDTVQQPSVQAAEAAAKQREADATTAAIEAAWRQQLADEAARKEQQAATRAQFAEQVASARQVKQAAADKVGLSLCTTLDIGILAHVQMPAVAKLCWVLMVMQVAHAHCALDQPVSSHRTTQPRLNMDWRRAHAGAP